MKNTLKITALMLSALSFSQVMASDKMEEDKENERYLQQQIRESERMLEDAGKGTATSLTSVPSNFTVPAAGVREGNVLYPDKRPLVVRSSETVEWAQGQTDRMFNELFYCADEALWEDFIK